MCDNSKVYTNGTGCRSRVLPFLFAHYQEFCDLEKRSAFGVYSGPQRLSTEDQDNPTAGPVHEKTPLFKVNGMTVSSTKVFIVDDVVVIFTGTKRGEIRKVKRNV